MTDITTHGSPTGANGTWTPNQSMRVLPNQKERWVDFKDPVSFDDAAEMILQAAKDDGERKDLGIGTLKGYIVGPRREDGVATLVTTPAPGREHREIPLRAHAFGQLCSRIGAPADYIRKLPAKIQMVNLNHGLQRGDDKGSLIRMADGEARAVLSHGSSQSYGVLDNEFVVETLRTTLRDAGLLGETRVRSLALGKTCSLRLTFPEHDTIIKNSPQVNDIVEVGLDVLNGEIGNRSISISPLTLRLFCLNGMRRADRNVATFLRHIGDPARLAESFRDAVPVALAATTGMRDRMERAVESMVDSVLDEFDALKAFGLSATESRDVARDVMTGRSVSLPSDHKHWDDMLSSIHDVSVYDVLNGVTHVAQNKPTDRRIEMEETAAKYLYRRIAA